MRVGFQGEAGAYSEEALLVLFPAATAIGFRTFEQTFDALQSGVIEGAVLPVENTLGGIVQEVNDLLWARSGLRLTGEYVHPIRHHLLGRRHEPPQRVISHPQALAQVRRFLEARALTAVPFYDTAGAARQVAERPEAGTAAVASWRAGQRYGLEVLAAGIQDSDSNHTRFVVAERGRPDRPLAGGPGWKTSLCFAAAHQPGSLVRALECFSARQVNLARLESRPLMGKPFEYLFFLDLHISDPDEAEAALTALERQAAEVRLFGTFSALSGGLDGGEQLGQ
ncbi:MAG: prephenate dehydratase [Candidatus Dormibacteraeota bacterium]|nr:prephenate dehydratase [Candidatus Dormibacteraeota bacterium]